MMSVLAIAVPAMALDGGYAAASEYLSTNEHAETGLWHCTRTVTNLQYMLEYLEYDPGPIDGIYGSLTAAAVSIFQSDHNLIVDGQCGYHTKIAIWEALDERPAGCYGLLVILHRKLCFLNNVD